MLKKLKIKLILNNMFLIGMVMLAVFIAICSLIYVSGEMKISSVLEDNIMTAQEEFEHSIITPIHPSDRIYKVNFTVFIDDNVVIIKQTETEFDSELIKEAIIGAMDYDYDRGNLYDLGLSFLRKPVKNGTFISFISREHLEARMNETIVATASVGFLSLLLFLYISNRLADIAIKPVKEAWDQQKQFLADASHDLKTPITVILANNNIISSHKEETVESQMKWIDSTAEEASRMSDLVNKMLELAKSEATKEELKFGEINLSEVVENSILQFEVVAFEKNLTIESGIQPNIIVKTHAPTFSKVLEDRKSVV